MSCVIAAANDLSRSRDVHSVRYDRARSVTRNDLRRSGEDDRARPTQRMKEQAMRIRFALGLTVLFGLVACGGAAQNTKGEDSDVWSGYKGTYASAKEAGRTSPAVNDRATDTSKKKDVKAKAETEEATAEEATDDTSTETPAPTASASSKKSK